MMGPKRFGDLRPSLPGISANVLTQRLEGLEAAGVLGRRKLPPPAAAQVYELTAWGYESEPIFQALGRWAARSPTHDPTLPFSAASLLLSLRTMLDPARARGIDAKIGFRLGDETYLGHLADGTIAHRQERARRGRRRLHGRTAGDRGCDLWRAASSSFSKQAGGSADRRRSRARRAVHHPLPAAAESGANGLMGSRAPPALSSVGGWHRGFDDVRNLRRRARAQSL